MLNDLLSRAVKTKNGPRSCAIPAKCNSSEGRSFDQIMESEWEELVIRFDTKKDDFVIKTACCPGAPAC